MNYYIDTVNYGEHKNKWDKYQVKISGNVYCFFDFIEALKFAAYWDAWPMTTKGGTSEWWK